jgi:hypothetical protein
MCCNNFFSKLNLCRVLECETYDANMLKRLICTLTSIGKESTNSNQFGYTKGMWYTRKSAFFDHLYLHLFTLMHHSVLLLSLTQFPSHLLIDWIPNEGDNTIHLLVAFSNNYKHTWKNPHSSEVALICSTCSSCFCHATQRSWLLDYSSPINNGVVVLNVPLELEDI